MRQNEIVTGDCVQLLAALPDNSVDLVFADPPFNIGFKYDAFDDSRTDADYLAWSYRWIMEVHRVLKPTGTFWLAIGDEYVAHLRLLAGSDLLRSLYMPNAVQLPPATETLAISHKPFSLRSWVVWYYTFGVNCVAKFTRSHAHLLYFTKSTTGFTFNSNDIRVPSARQLEYNDKRANPAGRLPDDTWILRPKKLEDGFPATGDVWFIPRIAGSFKQREVDAANQMPEQLLGRVVRACSNPGDLVLDPFAGTGTTAAVAKKLGRQYLSFELSESYAERCRRRLASIAVGEPLQGEVPVGG